MSFIWNRAPSGCGTITAPPRYLPQFAIRSVKLKRARVFRSEHHPPFEGSSKNKLQPPSRVAELSFDSIHRDLDSALPMFVKIWNRSTKFEIFVSMTLLFAVQRFETLNLQFISRIPIYFVPLSEANSSRTPRCNKPAGNFASRNLPAASFPVSSNKGKPAPARFSKEFHGYSIFSSRFRRRHSRCFSMEHRESSSRTLIFIPIIRNL